LYPRREISVRGDANCEPQPQADVGCVEANFQAYVEDLKKRKGLDADQAHRIAYKRLVRA
jgi:hypothetical protein